MQKLKNTAKKFPKVSIVFVNWNAKKDTFELLDSLKKIEYPNYDIIIVDNGSSQKIEREFNKKYKNFADLILNYENLGLAKGTNVGIKEALRRKSKYILTMNNDMYVDKKFLNFLVEPLEKDEKIGVAGPKIYYSNPKNMIWSAGCDYKMWGFKSRFQNEIDKGQADEEKEVGAIDCALIMRAKTLKEEGLFDEGFFIIDEFTEWCLRISKKGWKSYFVPKSKIWHKVASSLKGKILRNKIEVYYNSRNWLLDIKKNKTFSYFLIVLFLHSTIFAAFRSYRYVSEKKSYLIKYYFKGVLDAIIENKGQTKL